MAIKIGISDSPLFDNLVHNYDKIKKRFDLEIYRFPSAKIADLYQKEKLDMAMLNPIEFSEMAGEGDNRIISTRCLALEEYTKELSLEFNPNASKIKTIAYSDDDNYLGMIARIILAERYDSFPEKLGKNSKEIADVELKWRAGTPQNTSLDLSELWFDTYEFPLILGFWICRGDFDACDPVELTNTLFDSRLPDEVKILEEIKTDEYSYESEGNIHYKWTEDLKQSLSELLELLFVSQIIDAVPEVKMFEASK